MGVTIGRMWWHCGPVSEVIQKQLWALYLSAHYFVIWPEPLDRYCSQRLRKSLHDEIEYLQPSIIDDDLSSIVRAANDDFDENLSDLLAKYHNGSLSRFTQITTLSKAALSRKNFAPDYNGSYSSDIPIIVYRVGSCYLAGLLIDDIQMSCAFRLLSRSIHNT